jgi:hypothetical protein
MKIETRSHFTPVSITLETQDEVDRLFMYLDRESRNEFCTGDTFTLVCQIALGLSRHTSLEHL